MSISSKILYGDILYMVSVCIQVVWKGLSVVTSFSSIYANEILFSHIHSVLDNILL